MAETISVFSLDYDRSFEEIEADKHDGYVEYEEGASSISQNVVFPEAPPIQIDSITTLKNINTPPPYLGDVAKCVLIHKNGFMPVEHQHVRPTAISRQEIARREARVLKEVNRQTAFKEAASGKNKDQALRTAFLIISVAIAAATVVTVISIAALNFWPGAQSA